MNIVEEEKIGNLTIAQAWDKLVEIENKISLLETLRTTKKDVKAIKLKEIILSNGVINNSGIINAITTSDEYSEELLLLYTSRNAYEKYIFDEIKRLKNSQPSIVIGFLKDHQKLKWNEITKFMDYSDKQCRRYYAEYKGKTPQNNTFYKDDQL